MNKILITGFALASAIAAFGGHQNDLLVTLKTKGVLTYKYGELASDNCALVWTPKGKTFGGFLADGTLADDYSKLIATVAIKNGKLPVTTFELSSVFVDENELRGGKFGLYLLDTRDADGNPVGISVKASAGKATEVVNNYAKIAGGDDDATIGGASYSEKLESEAESVSATTQTLLPAGIEEKAVVKAVRIEDDEFVVTIEKPADYLRYYGKKANKGLGEFKRDNDVKVERTADGDIELRFPTNGADSMFIDAQAERNF